MYVLMKDFLPTIQAHADLSGKGGGRIVLDNPPPPWKIQAFKIPMIVNYQQKMTLDQTPCRQTKHSFSIPMVNFFFLDPRMTFIFGTFVAIGVCLIRLPCSLNGLMTT